MTRREMLSSAGFVLGAISWPTGQREKNDRAELISMIRLIANPNAYDNVRVRLAGYVENNGLDKSVGLYISEADGRYFIISNSISLHGKSVSTMREFVGKYVLLNATYNAPKGAGSEFLNGHLDQISGLMVIPAKE